MFNVFLEIALQLFRQSAAWQRLSVGTLRKNVFQVHGADEHGRAVFNKPLKREQMASFFVNLPAWKSTMRIQNPSVGPS